METGEYAAKYCIIGAGPAGITAAKNLKALKIPFDVIERQDEVGGVWYYGKPHSAAYRSTHLNSSKTMSQFADYPMPRYLPDYPHHTQVLAYLRDYAHHFGLYEYIQFNTSVEHVERTANGEWDITVQREGQSENSETRRYKGLIIANGHLWDPRYPNNPGPFNGLSLHSKDYKTPDVLRDKRVLVVGAGNSGCEIAVEAIQHASRVFLSLRRGYHIIPDPACPPAA
jgi:cation diffusion facilitator CzcD-associated flavoprotein CzcO